MSTATLRDKGEESLTHILSPSLSADQFVCQAVNQPVPGLFSCPRGSFLLFWILLTLFFLLPSYRQHYYFWRKMFLIATSFLRFSLYTRNYDTLVSTLQAQIISSLLHLKWKMKWDESTGPPIRMQMPIPLVLTWPLAIKSLPGSSKIWFGTQIIIYKQYGFSCPALQRQRA